MELTNEQKRIRIAEACGWISWPAENAGPAARLFYGDVWFRHPESNTIACPKNLPDYFNDLNAMHEAEKNIPQTKWSKYCLELSCVSGMATCKESLWMLLVSATAAQRAEAFGRTLKLW